jgi:hypothetical protein
MDSFNPRENQKIQKAYESVQEKIIPYDGTHVPHQSSIDHIKKVYGCDYKVVKSDSTGSWYVMGKNGDDYVPVTAPFADQGTAEKFKKWLDDAEDDTQKMVGTIDGEPRLRDNPDGTETSASTSKLTK